MTSLWEIMKTGLGHLAKAPLMIIVALAALASLVFVAAFSGYVEAVPATIAAVLATVVIIVEIKTDVLERVPRAFFGIIALAAGFALMAAGLLAATTFATMILASLLISVLLRPGVLDGIVHQLGFLPATQLNTGTAQLHGPDDWVHEAVAVQSDDSSTGIGLQGVISSARHVTGFGRGSGELMVAPENEMCTDRGSTLGSRRNEQMMATTGSG